jgi:hypothetical protein
MERAKEVSGSAAVREIEIRLRVSTGLLRAAFLALMTVLPATELASESVTLTTYYPAPSGIYSQMITTGDTVLAKNAGTVTVGGSMTVAGGMTVGGLLKVASMGTDPAGTDGAIFYSNSRKAFMGFYNGAWHPIGEYPAGKPIVCSAWRDPPTVTNGPGRNYGFSFTAADCGGVLPDTSYIPAVKSAKMCDGIEHFHALSAGEPGPGSNYSGSNVVGPGIVMFFNAKDVDGPCQWPEYGNTRMQATIVYIKR